MTEDDSPNSNESLIVDVDSISKSLNKQLNNLQLDDKIESKNKVKIQNYTYTDMIIKNTSRILKQSEFIFDNIPPTQDTDEHIEFDDYVNFHKSIRSLLKYKQDRVFNLTNHLVFKCGDKIRKKKKIIYKTLAGNVEKII